MCSFQTNQYQKGGSSFQGISTEGIDWFECRGVEKCIVGLWKDRNIYLCQIYIKCFQQKSRGWTLGGDSWDALAVQSDRPSFQKIHNQR